MRIAQKMLELMDLLDEGFKRVDIDTRIECEEEWNDAYAIIELYYDADGFDYFDEDRFREDLGDYLIDHFSADGFQVEYTVREEPSPVRMDGKRIVIRHHIQSQELEVYKC